MPGTGWPGRVAHLEVLWRHRAQAGLGAWPKWAGRKTYLPCNTKQGCFGNKQTKQQKEKEGHEPRVRT